MVLNKIALPPFWRSSAPRWRAFSVMRGASAKPTRPSAGQAPLLSFPLLW